VDSELQIISSRVRVTVSQFTNSNVCQLTERQFNKYYRFETANATRKERKA
jgi:hypothetical protein